MSKWINEFDVSWKHWVVYFEEYDPRRYPTAQFATREREDAEFLTDILNNNINKSTTKPNKESLLQKLKRIILKRMGQ